MSHILITGASGFIGSALVKHIGQTGQHQLTLIDQHFATNSGIEKQRQLTGSFGNAALLEQALQNPVDIVFHLASVPGSAAEANAALGTQINLLDTQSLFNRLSLGRSSDGTPVRVVFASTIAVYGAIGAQPCSEDLKPQPTISYGTHKWMSEILLADLTRRGQLDARSLRLPGIVARPTAPPHAPSGLGSAFMSDLIRNLAAGKAYTCPVSEHATAWWMSRPCCIKNLMHASALAPIDLNASRVWQLPVLHASIGQIVEALKRRYGADKKPLVSFEPNSKIEALFGALPPLQTPLACAQGFEHDGDLDTLITNSLL